MENKIFKGDDIHKNIEDGDIVQWDEDQKDVGVKKGFMLGVNGFFVMYPKVCLSTPLGSIEADISKIRLIHVFQNES